jgi:hypothetical protein
MRAFLACGGKSVNYKPHVCDDWIDIPLGILTLIGMCVTCLLVHGAVADKKLILHPESSIAVSSFVAVKMIGIQSKVNEN